MIQVIYVNLNNAEEAVQKNDGYCPCKLVHCPDNKCMCKQFREQIARKELGLCECGLYEVEDTERK